MRFIIATKGQVPRSDRREIAGIEERLKDVRYEYNRLSRWCRVASKKFTLDRATATQAAILEVRQEIDDLHEQALEIARRHPNVAVMYPPGGRKKLSVPQCLIDRLGHVTDSEDFDMHESHAGEEQ